MPGFSSESSFPGNEPERFTASYRKAGGAIELLYIEQAARQSAASYDPVAAFFRKQMPVERPVEATVK